MSSILYAGTGGVNVSCYNTGTTRWNTTTNQMEMYNGQQWVAVSAGYSVPLTLADIVQNAEDQIAVMVEEEYPDNATIQDAFDEWEEANKRFKVILSLSKTK